MRRVAYLYADEFIRIVAYVFLEWNGEDEHSVVEGKVVELVDHGSGFIPGANVQCVLREGKFSATIITTGKSF